MSKISDPPLKRQELTISKHSKVRIIQYAGALSYSVIYLRVPCQMVELLTKQTHISEIDRQTLPELVTSPTLAIPL